MAGKHRDDVDVFNWKLYGTKEATDQYIAPPWRYSEFTNLYDDKKLQQHINSVELKLTHEKEGPSKEVVVQDQRWIGRRTSASTSYAPKMSYLYISEKNCSSMEGYMRTDLAAHTLSNPSSSSNTSHLRGEMIKNRKKTKELVLHNQPGKSSSMYSFISGTFFSKGSSSSIKESDGFVFNTDTQQLVVSARARERHHLVLTCVVYLCAAASSCCVCVWTYM